MDNPTTIKEDDKEEKEEKGNDDDIIRRITKPTLILDKAKCIKNIRFMAAKTRITSNEKPTTDTNITSPQQQEQEEEENSSSSSSSSSTSSIKLRPHCKTHASLEIASWLQEYGNISGITVSSWTMAEYFATANNTNHNNNNHNNNTHYKCFDDITVAFPLNILEIETKVQRILQLSTMNHLNVLVENVTAVKALQSKLLVLPPPPTAAAAALSKGLYNNNNGNNDTIADNNDTTTKNNDDPFHYLDKLGIFIKIDVGYGRTGIPAQNLEQIDQVIQAIVEMDQQYQTYKTNNFNNNNNNNNNNKIIKHSSFFKGFLTHAGHTYHCRSPEHVKDIYYKETVPLMTSLRNRYQGGRAGGGGGQQFPKLFPNLQLSMGDTPTCSIVDASSMCHHFDEMRPGNYVFYDIEQYMIGSCSTMNDIAVAVACPIVAKHSYPNRKEIVIYGGGVHCSKDRIQVPTLSLLSTKLENVQSKDNNKNDDKNSQNETTTTTTTTSTTTIFGRVAKRKENNTNNTNTNNTTLEWGPVIDGMYVRSFSQEHGIIVVPDTEDMMNDPAYEIGSILFILPVHSCMTADCLKHYGYFTTTGEWMERMKE